MKIRLISLALVLASFFAAPAFASTLQLDVRDNPSMADIIDEILHLRVISAVDANNTETISVKVVAKRISCLIGLRDLAAAEALIAIMRSSPRTHLICENTNEFVKVTDGYAAMTTRAYSMTVGAPN